MKKTKILVGLLIAHALNSCSLFTDAEPTLPPATQNGAETFGCLVNGKVFVAKGGGNYRGLTKDYDGSVILTATYVKNGEVESSAGLSTPRLNGVGTYIIEHQTGLWHTSSGWNWYGKENKPVRSKLVITKFERGEDKTNNLKWLIVSGTFEGVLLPEKNAKDTLYITQGRFDVKFQ